MSRKKPIVVEVRGQRHHLTEELRIRVERRVQFALGRFGHRIDRVIVRLKDINAPHGNTHTWCGIEVSGLPSWRVIVGDADADLYTAIDLAAHRASRSVVRTLERWHELAVHSPKKRMVGGIR